ncbi:MAG: hypothetical protein JWL96_2857 [Sphingomonas bacterium]|uniref:hypothetical protein n=1 Tax=Sphingomonas bacterium TaxID=1895847 RepID=UPI002622F605|nr:hypothetical protein [Sphingomonas bacterium]MDB5710787.1 hypothetical protein [Sphingomonas bacterium]
MQSKRKPTALILAIVVAVVQWIIKPLWDSYLQNTVQPAKLGATVGWQTVIHTFWAIVAYIPNSFSVGFVTGALIFAYWDTIIPAFRRHVLRKAAPEIADARDGLRAWVGSIVFSVDEKDEGNASLTLRVINFGNVPFSIRSLSGHTILKHDDGSGKHTKTKLPPPYLRHDQAHLENIPPGYVVTVLMDQRLPPNITRLLPDIFTWSARPYLVFNELNIDLTADKMPASRLKLWDSIRLTAGPWQVRGVQTFPMFESDDEAEKFRESMAAVAAVTTGLARR